MKKCTGRIYKINGKTFCVGEKKTKNKKGSRVKRNTNKFRRGGATQTENIIQPNTNKKENTIKEDDDKGMLKEIKELVVETETKEYKFKTIKVGNDTYILKEAELSTYNFIEPENIPYPLVIFFNKKYYLAEYSKQYPIYNGAVININGKDYKVAVYPARHSQIYTITNFSLDGITQNANFFPYRNIFKINNELYFTKTK
jgi:hypothetical protein